MSKLDTHKLESLTKDFWDKLEENWIDIANNLIDDNPAIRKNALKCCNTLLQDLSDYVDLEFTVGEINRIYFEDYDNIIEMYISPKLSEDNIPIMNYIISQSRKLQQLRVYAYRAFNYKDDLIEEIAYDPETPIVKYTDFGCQYTNGIDDANPNDTTKSNRKPVIDLVILVKNPIAKHILSQREVTVMQQDGSKTSHFVWLPKKNNNIIDTILVNIIGDYNLIHRTRHIAFLPEDDPLIVADAKFEELGMLREMYEIISDKKRCATCNRRNHQCQLKICTRCKETNYCSIDCQKIDFNNHKKFCK